MQMKMRRVMIMMMTVGYQSFEVLFSSLLPFLLLLLLENIGWLWSFVV